MKQSGSNNPPSSEKTLEELFSSLGDLNLEDGEGENLENVLEGMMSQLMSKEILYEPLKELHDKVRVPFSHPSPIYALAYGLSILFYLLVPPIP